MPEAAAIEVRNLNKTFVSQAKGRRKIHALCDVNLTIRQGEIVGILGPNGAGKTTLLNILSTLLLPDSGTVSILGIKSTPQNFKTLRSFLNMSSGYPNFPWCLTVEENLRFYGRLYGLSARVLDEKISKLLGMLELTRFARTPFDELSSGTKQKLSLAKALINDPRIIFLDEPTIGLDPDVAVKLQQTILDILRTSPVTVLLTTHNMLEAERLCQRVAFIKEGQVLKLAAPEELKRLYGGKTLEQVFIELARTRSTEPPEASSQKRADTEERFLSEDMVTSSANPAREVVGWFIRCWTFFRRNFIFGSRNFFSFMELLFWPVVSLVSIGLLGDFVQMGRNALGFVLTGAISAGILQVTQLDVAYGLLYDVWSKSMKQTLLTPVGVAENLFGSWLNGIIRGTLIFVILALAAWLLFHFPFPPAGVVLIFLFGIFGCALLLGMLVHVLLLAFGQKAEITAWMFAYLFMLISGIYYPITTLPPFFRWLAQWIPITYFLEYLRQYFDFPPSLTHVLIKGFGLVLIYLALGLLGMKAVLRRARRKGIIVRLSE
ncbi:MAG: ABC transporter ATP-binding protein/permease [Candidatus Omnitrophica bacterium]|nr:ABC transporter ATP-binding protein/permease [Candidatus Omnitrophota bacterium]